jgi:DNA-binding transcriptional ArsR family regulator
MNRRIPSSPDDVEQALLWAVSDPIRHKIIVHLSVRPQSVGKLASRFPIVRAAISRHLKILLDAGLVTSRRTGPYNIYAVRPEPLEQLRTHFSQISHEASRVREAEPWLDAA